MRFRRATMGLSGTAIVFLACDSGPPLGPQTWMVDCIAVLGSPPPSAQTPLAGVPYSGAPRDKRIGELTDDELGKLCDFDQCLLNNGYRHDCCTTGYCFSTSPGAIGPFKLETVPLIADLMDTCNLTTADEAGAPSREDSVSLYRRYFGACHVSLWEDCNRELSVDPFGAFGWGPDCHEKDSVCTAQ